ncbi:hypothetical protein LSM04_001858 [Trypanosoma melophagium]|uniref:uncharacterized protein n=1 Tax=Trypanosoma melophagium TaxID=715481 RepID=UPI00351A60B6|nr:hypothetical protein LSM04_001858 [Trypanosoma melophagium]
MIRQSALLRWTPRYFTRSARSLRSGPQGSLAARSRNVSPRPMAAHAATSTCTGRVGATGASAVFPEGRECKRCVEHSGELSPMANSSTAETVSAIVQKAESLLSRWQQLDERIENHQIGSRPCFHRSFSSGAVEDTSHILRMDAVQFEAKNEVFSVLRTILPPPKRRCTNVEPCSSQSTGDESMAQGGVPHTGPSLTDGLVVIPDEAAPDAEGYLRRVRSGHRTGEVQSGVTLLDGEQQRPALLSMGEIAVFAELYHALECEDGTLLLQLMAELRCLVLAPVKRLADKTMPPSEGDFGSAISQLLLTLSSLGLVEERVLQSLTSPRGPFLSPAQLAHQDAGDLVRLLVAFHRFGLHHEPCFKMAVRALKRRSLRGPLRSCVETIFAQSNGDAFRGGLAEADMVSACMARLTVNNLLEAMAAIALSLHREKVVVELLAATVVVAVWNDERMSVDSATGRQMELGQVALANLLHRLSICHSGLLVNSGEDPLSPERVGFYDPVTADLVKVNRS